MTHSPGGATFDTAITKLLLYTVFQKKLSSFLFRCNVYRQQQQQQQQQQ